MLVEVVETGEGLHLGATGQFHQVCLELCYFEGDGPYLIGYSKAAVVRDILSDCDLPIDLNRFFKEMTIPLTRLSVTGSILLPYWDTKHCFLCWKVAKVSGRHHPLRLPSASYWEPIL